MQTEFISFACMTDDLWRLKAR